MSESNAIATINSMEGFQRLAQFSTSAAAKELAGFNMRFDRVKVPSGGGLTFMLQERMPMVTPISVRSTPLS